MSDVMVSVYCTAYNHKNYIRSALDGFVAQKTNFKYEVIVHDDASTDGTADIIREYAERYPNIFRPIFQTENQYSQGKKISLTFIFPLIRGKYVAVCEGDDYWCDPNKLQRQVDFLESNPDYAACAHNTRTVHPNGIEAIKYGNMDKDIEPGDVIIHGGNAYHTSSLMYRAHLRLNRPAFVTSIKRVGDYPLSIYLALCGKIRYFGDVMSVYRTWTEGSWTGAHENEEKQLYTLNQIISMLQMANEYSEFKLDGLFLAAIQYHKQRICYNTCLLNGDYRGMRRGKNRGIYKAKSRGYKIRLFLSLKAPALHSFLRKVKRIAKRT